MAGLAILVLTGLLVFLLSRAPANEVKLAPKPSESVSIVEVTRNPATFAHKRITVRGKVEKLIAAPYLTDVAGFSLVDESNNHIDVVTNSSTPFPGETRPVTGCLTYGVALGGKVEGLHLMESIGPCK